MSLHEHIIRLHEEPYTEQLHRDIIMNIHTTLRSLPPEGRGKKMEHYIKESFRKAHAQMSAGEKGVQKRPREEEKKEGRSISRSRLTLRTQEIEAYEERVTKAASVTSNYYLSTGYYRTVTKIWWTPTKQQIEYIQYHYDDKQNTHETALFDLPHIILSDIQVEDTEELISYETRKKIRTYCKNDHHVPMYYTNRINPFAVMKLPLEGHPTDWLWVLTQPFKYKTLVESGINHLKFCTIKGSGAKGPGITSPDTDMYLVHHLVLPAYNLSKSNRRSIGNYLYGIHRSLDDSPHAYHMISGKNELLSWFTSMMIQQPEMHILYKDIKIILTPPAKRENRRQLLPLWTMETTKDGEVLIPSKENGLHSYLWVMDMIISSQRRIDEYLRNFYRYSHQYTVYRTVDTLPESIRQLIFTNLIPPLFGYLDELLPEFGMFLELDDTPIDPFLDYSLDTVPIEWPERYTLIRHVDNTLICYPFQMPQVFDETSVINPLSIILGQRLPRTLYVDGTRSIEALMEEGIGIGADELLQPGNADLVALRLRLPDEIHAIEHRISELRNSMDSSLTLSLQQQLDTEDSEEADELRRLNEQASNRELILFDIQNNMTYNLQRIPEESIQEWSEGDLKDDEKTLEIITEDSPQTPLINRDLTRISKKIPVDHWGCHTQYPIPMSEYTRTRMRLVQQHIDLLYRRYRGER